VGAAATGLLLTVRMAVVLSAAGSHTHPQSDWREYWVMTRTKALAAQPLNDLLIDR
jgi:hypothetical protein